MFIKVNKYGYITSYCTIGSMENSIEIDNIDENILNDIYNYQYIDNELIYNPIPENKQSGINMEYDGKQWVEQATDEELKEFYFNLINKYKIEILQVGFDFNGHQQKCREKDLALLSNAVSALDDMQTFKVIVEEHQINWAFNDNDIVNMTETDLRKLRMSGAIFINTVYGVEAQLKASEANILLEKQDFIKKVDELSTVKCFKSSI